MDGFLFLYGKPTIPWPVVSLNMSAFALSEVGVVVLPWSPLAGGFFTGKYRRDEDKPEGWRRAEFYFPPVDKEEAYEAVEVMDKIAEDINVSIPQIALAWLLHQPGITAPIIGAKKMSQLEDNLASTEIDLTKK